MRDTTRLLTYRLQISKFSAIDFQTADNTATASYDYASTQKSITFTKDSMTQTIEVPIYDDNYKEGNGVVNNVDFMYREVT